ncbi:MAG: hypothetical protein ACYDCD_03600 [Candidatus Acidiferrales bacterium]
MPEAFGTFEPESLIVYDTVCVVCNNYFGRTLELAAAQNTPPPLCAPANEGAPLSTRVVN